jgi:hypothetical protein
MKIYNNSSFIFPFKNKYMDENISERPSAANWHGCQPKMLPSSTLPPLKWKLAFQKKRVGACAALIEGCTVINHFAPHRLGDRATPRAPFVARTPPALHYCRVTLLRDRSCSGITWPLPHSSPSLRPPPCVGRCWSTSASPSSNLHNSTPLAPPTACRAASYCRSPWPPLSLSMTNPSKAPKP